MNACVEKVLGGFAVLGLASLGYPASAQIIDHRAIPRVESLPQATIDQIGQLRWYFIHASVGDNIMRGLRDLHQIESVRYPLVGCTLTSSFAPPVPTVPGSVYEHHFTSDKMPQFQSLVNSNGWHRPAVDVALMKFCYLEGLATALTPGPQLATQYVAMMASLEQRHPDTVFVRVSMPLLIYREEGDPRRDAYYIASLVSINRFNDSLRADCRVNNRLLYDLADIESHDPAGNQATFRWTDGQTYPVVYASYVYDTNRPPGANSGHLIAPGRQQVAKGWYALAAAIVSNLTVRPRLDWSQEARRLHFSWSDIDFVLQQNTNVTWPAGWHDIPGADQGSHTVICSNAPAAFFRLRKR